MTTIAMLAQRIELAPRTPPHQCSRHVSRGSVDVWPHPLSRRRLEEKPGASPPPGRLAKDLAQHQPSATTSSATIVPRVRDDSSQRASLRRPTSVSTNTCGTSEPSLTVRTGLIGASNSSLPPRPPPAKSSGFKPAFSSVPTHTPSPGATANPYAPPSYSSAPTYSSAPSYPGASAPQYGASYSAYHQPGAPPPVSGTRYGPQASRPYQSHPQSGYGQQDYYGPTTDASSYAATPQIRNPFPTPGQPQQNSDYDPDMAAQIAQWQSAYVKDPKDASIPAAGARPGTTTTYAAEPSTKLADPNPQNPEKKKTVVRSGGGQKWTDDTLVEWDPAHLRLFVGNLAGETTDESLFKAFSRWKSLQKARVIRDKITSKSKGFGFVSFSDPDEFFSAAKEMNGKYIQSHPVVVRKSTTEIKPTTVKDKHHGGKWNKNKNKNKNRGGNGGGAGGGTGGQGGSYEPSLGPQGGGVTKPGQKTKNGLKLLG